MSVIKISEAELDKRILKMLEGGGYKNAVIESFRDIASKRAVTQSIARLRQQGQIAIVHGSGDPELGTYYEAIHWIGDKPLLGPARSSESEWTSAMAAYKAEHDRWADISSWVMIARCEARGVGFFVLIMVLVPAIIGFFVNIPKVFYFAGAAGAAFCLGTEFSASRLRHVEKMLEQQEPVLRDGGDRTWH